MHSTPANLILFELVAGVMILIGFGVLRFARRPGAAWLTMRVLGRVLIVFGFFLIVHLLSAYFLGQLGPLEWSFRMAPFFLAAGFLGSSLFWWARHHWLAAKSGRPQLVAAAGYPLLVIGLSAGIHALIQHELRTRSEAFHANLISTQGQPAPEMEFLDSDGHKRSLSEFKGKVVMLNFWATTCGPCVHEMPDLSTLQHRFQSQGFALIFLSSEDVRTVTAFFKGRNLEGINGRLVSEFSVPEFYQAGRVFPTSFLIDRNGVVQFNWVGAAPADWIALKIERQL